MSTGFSIFNPPHDSGKRADWPLLEGFALALAVSTWAGRKGGPVLVVSADGYSARRLRDDINLLAGVRAEIFPDPEILPYDLNSPHPDLTSPRLNLLPRLPAIQGGVSIPPVAPLIQQRPPVPGVRGRRLALSV